MISRTASHLFSHHGHQYRRLQPTNKRKPHFKYILHLELLSCQFCSSRCQRSGVIDLFRPGTLYVPTTGEKERESLSIVQIDDDLWMVPRSSFLQLASMSTVEETGNWIEDYQIQNKLLNMSRRFSGLDRELDKEKPYTFFHNMDSDS